MASHCNGTEWLGYWATWQFHEIKVKGWNVAKATYINFLVVESRQKKMPGSDTDSPKNSPHPDGRQHSICMVTNVISYLPHFPSIKTK